MVNSMPSQYHITAEITVRDLSFVAALIGFIKLVATDLHVHHKIYQNKTSY